MGTDTPGHTLFLECCITNGYTGRWGFTPAHVQCRQIWARRVYASHLCAKHKTSLPSPHLLPITPSLKKEAEKRKKLIQKRMKCSFFFWRVCHAAQTSEFRRFGATLLFICMCVCEHFQAGGRQEPREKAPLTCSCWTAELTECVCSTDRWRSLQQGEFFF